MTASAVSIFFVRYLDGFPQDLVLDRLLAQEPLQLPNLLLQGQDLRVGDHFIVRLGRLFAAFAHAPLE
jgi:hypothetical protein